MPMKPPAMPPVRLPGLIVAELAVLNDKLTFAKLTPPLAPAVTPCAEARAGTNRAAAAHSAATERNIERRVIALLCKNPCGYLLGSAWPRKSCLSTGWPVVET